jgi:hypothetical protein
MTQEDRLFEEYKLFLENTHNLSDRRQRAAQTFLVVNTATIGVFGLLIADAQLSGWNLAVASLPLLILGIATNALWHNIVDKYRRLIGWRYEQLRLMEASLGQQGASMILSKEYETYYHSEVRRDFSFSATEVWLPRLMIIIYVCYALGYALAWIFDCIGGP